MGFASRPVGDGLAFSSSGATGSGRKKLRFDLVIGLFMISATAAARSSSGNLRRFLLADIRGLLRRGPVCGQDPIRNHPVILKALSFRIYIRDELPLPDRL